MCRLSSAVSSFNRSVAKSPSATIIRASALPPSAEFQSLSREKPFCHGGPRERASRPRRTACREFQSLSREKPFCHTGEADLVLADGKFQSLSREKPFCHDGSIALHWPKRAFQSLSREKPFCHSSNAKTTATICPQFQSLSREKPFCHQTSTTASLGRAGFQSLSREKPFCHSSDIEYDCNFIEVSIAQSRKALLPPQRIVALLEERLVSIAQSRKALLPLCASNSRLCSYSSSFNRSVAKSPSATSMNISRAHESHRFQSLSREKPFCHRRARSLASTRHTTVAL